MKTNLALPIYVILVSLAIFQLIEDAECKRRGSSGGSKGRHRNFFSSGNGKQSRTNIGNSYSSGGWNQPTKAANVPTSTTSNANIGHKYSGGGWKQPTKPNAPTTTASSANVDNKHLGGGWNKPIQPNVPTSTIPDISKSSNTGKKGFFRKNWKKAVAFGAGAYVGHKLTENVGKLFRPNLYHYNGIQYNFDTWDRYARVDGWVCRNDNDCWMDANLECDDEQFTITAIKGGWPWKAELRGRCSCKDGLIFNQSNGTCSNGNLPSWAMIVIAIVFVVVIIAIGTCFWCGICCLF